MALIAGATYAFFTDSETSTGNTFTAGRLDLKVNEQDDPVGLVTIEDFKPGDDRFVDKRLSVDFNPAKVWVHLRDLSDSQGTQTEPETLEENGQPHSNLQDVVTYDLTVQTDPANPVITFADNVTMTQAHSCWIPLGVIPGNNVTTVVRQSFHFPSNVTNWAQGDLLNFTEEFYATQVNNPGGPPPTAEGRVWNDQTNQCENAIVDKGEPFADSVVAVNGTYGHCCGSLASDTATAASMITGPNDSPPNSNFIQISKDSSVTARFDNNKAINGPGADLRIHVYDTLYPATATLEVTDDPTCSSNWENAGVISDTANTDIDIDPLTLTEVRCVKLTDLGGPDTTFLTLGFDLDAIEALNSVALP